MMEHTEITGPMSNKKNDTINDTDTTSVFDTLTFQRKNERRDKVYVVIQVSRGSLVSINFIENKVFSIHDDARIEMCRSSASGINIVSSRWSISWWK